jgi:hypothetical protein
MNGAEPNDHGYALSIAAAPPVKRPMDAAAALHQLAAVPPAVLLGTATASALQLVDPAEPQTLLAHLRTAAQAPGPVLVYLAGHLVLDPRQHQPHLALARTSSRTVRYTAMPWRWLADELRGRPATTTVIADLVTDPAAWAALAEEDEPLRGPYDLFGVAAPPPGRSEHPAPAYSHALATVLRGITAPRPPMAQLHAQALRTAGLSAGPGIVLGPNPDAPPPAVPSETVPAPRSAAPTVAEPSVAAPAAAVEEVWDDQHRAISQAMNAGRLGEAYAIVAACEAEVLRTRGPDSLQAAHWTEVRAWITQTEQRMDRACELWIWAAVTRLSNGQTNQDTALQEAVDFAHGCWTQVRDPATARTLGVDLVSLRARVPGSKPGALADVQRRLAALNPAPAAQQ